MISKTPFSVPISDIDLMNSQLPVVEKRLVLNKPINSFFYDPWVIKDEFKNTVWEKVLNQLPNSIGEARIIKLVPGECYFGHADIDDRFHISLSGNYCYLIDLDNEKMHSVPKDGYWYTMDTSHRHSAVNFGEIDRYQLVVRKLLLKGKHIDVIKVTISPAYPQVEYRYYFDHIISPWLNVRNKQGMLDDFTIENSDTISFTVHSSQVQEIKKLLDDRFYATFK